MTNPDIHVEGLDELLDKLTEADKDIQEALKNTMEKSLLVLWENVPAYPKLPESPKSSYRRTGTLGRSLGSSYGGGKSGAQPTVYSIKQQMNNVEGRFGTNLSYAPYVIGPSHLPKGQRQAYMHKPGFKGRPGWWTMTTIRERSVEKIQKLWEITMRHILKRFK
jgi:hypothetical protein